MVSWSDGSDSREHTVEYMSSASDDGTIKEGSREACCFRRDSHWQEVSLLCREGLQIGCHRRWTYMHAMFIAVELMAVNFVLMNNMVMFGVNVQLCYLFMNSSTLVWL